MSMGLSKSLEDAGAHPGVPQGRTTMTPHPFQTEPLGSQSPGESFTSQARRRGKMRVLVESQSFPGKDRQGRVGGSVKYLEDFRATLPMGVGM